MNEKNKYTIILFAELLVSISVISHLPEEAALQLRNFEMNILRNWSWEFVSNSFVEDLNFDSDKRHSESSDVLNKARNLNKGVRRKNFYFSQHLVTLNTF